MIGQTIFHYEILKKLGEGGMGAVYQARDLRLDRMVALKFLASHLVSSTAAHMRFDREARAISRLNHPNIATLYGFEENDALAFLVLEFLSGGTLTSRLERAASTGNPLQIQVAIDWALQMVEGLAHAHRHGIVHRDVKPSNVLFSSEGALKITDFGLAKFRGISDITQPGSAMGTIAYISPEQAQGLEVDHRADIFSFGIVLYQMVTGQHPFQADSETAVMYKILNANPPSLETSRSDVPKDLEQIVFRALEKEPAKRYQSTEEVASDLRRVSAGQVASPSAPTVSVRFTTPSLVRHAHTRRWWVLGVAAFLIAALALTVFLLRCRIFGCVLPPPDVGIAVLPFTNVGSNAENRAFCDGLTETLTSTLNQLEEFQGVFWVVPASEMHSMHSVREARNAFGVTLVITGSVQRSGNEVRVIMNLVDAKAARQLSSTTVEAPVDGLNVLQDDVPRRLAELLSIHLKPQTAAAMRPISTQVPKAYDYYIQGLGYMARFDQAGGFENAVKSFESAIRQDQNYAPAFAGLGRAYIAQYDATEDPQWMAQAESATERALALSDRLPQAHVNLGSLYLHTGNYPQAFAEFQRALELDPVNPEAYRALAEAYAASGDLKRAEETYQQAIKVRRGLWMNYSNLGAFLLHQNRYEEAAKAFQKVIELTPDNPRGYLNLGAAYDALGQSQKAEQYYMKSLAVNPTGDAYSNLAFLYYFQGRFKEAAHMNERALEMSPANMMIWGNLGDAYRWTPEYANKAPGAYRRAIHIAEQRVSINPKDMEALLGLASYKAKLGQAKEALESLDRARKLSQSDVNVLFQTVIVYELAGARDRALQALEAALKAGYPREWILHEPELAKLREDERFKRVMPNTR